MSQATHSLVEFFDGKRVFITGHTGFMGSWLTIWLNLLGSRVFGYALNPPTSPSIFTGVDLSSRLAGNRIADVRDFSSLVEVLQQAQPDIVFHLAAQPLVRESYRTPRETLETNIVGTANLLEAIRKAPSVQVCIVVTSDKCYRNREWEFSYREDDELGGTDPYSASKACAELVVDAYRKSFLSDKRGRSVGLASARAGNVIGGGDWAKDRIIPDCILALRAGETIKVRNPQAMRPWQYVLESLSGYLWLATRLWHDPEAYSEAWNFGPVSDDWHSVRDLAEMVISAWGSGTWVDASDPSALHEAGLLRLSIDKAQARLGWLPTWRLHDAIQQTVAWYKLFYASSAPEQLLQACEASIEAYTAEAHTRGLEWAH
jgi:CDP-glucose 4,6-dehydratase